MTTETPDQADELVNLIYAHSPEECSQGKCKCGQIIGVSDGAAWEMDPWGHIEQVVGHWIAGHDDRIRTDAYHEGYEKGREDGWDAAHDAEGMNA